MRIQSVHVQDFKRFTDLKIENIPSTARLIMLTGPNGSGKSSLFEAFNQWSIQSRGFATDDKDYLIKTDGTLSNRSALLSEQLKIQFHDTARRAQTFLEPRKVFYFRSAYRHEADFKMDNMSNPGDPLDDSRRPTNMISQEFRVSDNYQRIMYDAINNIFTTENDEQTVKQIREKLIGRIRAAMQSVFPNLLLKGVGHPMKGGTFLFEKGISKNYHYKNLSGGEKTAFDILLDFIIKVNVFDDTIYCIDEPELHMNTNLQASLLEEMYRQIPKNCQLWIATHSIGMTRKAMEIYQANQSEVVFLDFGSRDFDTPQTIEPVKVGRQYWKRIFNVALDDLAELVAPSQIIFCEGSREINNIRKDPTFDAVVYRTIFGNAHPDTEFIALGGTSDIARDSIIISGALKQLFNSIKIYSLFDRDDLSDNEISDLKQKGTQVLGRRDLESYLWDDEVIEKICRVNGKSEQIPILLQRKIELLEESSLAGKPTDDIKAISGRLYNAVKISLALTKSGNKASSFARDTLAPLITPDMNIYQELERAVFQ